MIQEALQSGRMVATVEFDCAGLVINPFHITMPAHAKQLKQFQIIPPVFLFDLEHRLLSAFHHVPDAALQILDASVKAVVLKLTEVKSLPVDMLDQDGAALVSITKNPALVSFIARNKNPVAFYFLPADQTQYELLLQSPAAAFIDNIVDLPAEKGIDQTLPAVVSVGRGGVFKIAKN